MKRLLSCAAIALTLTGCGSLKNYTGPALRFSIGWNGIDAGITLYGKKPVAESLDDAGRAFDAIASPYASSGKTHVTAPP